MNEKIRVAIVGTGNWGRNHVRVFASSAACRVTHLVDTSDDSLARAHRVAPGAELLKDHRRLLDDNQFDAAVVATPAGTHHEIARDLLNAGKHVLVEKPLTLKTAHAQELVELSRAHNVKLMVGHLMLFHPAVRCVKEYITSGDLGEILYAAATRVSPALTPQTEDALWAFAPHDISAVTYLLDRAPEAGQALGGFSPQSGIPGPAVAVFTLRFRGNVMAHGRVSWLDPQKIRKLTIVGARKTVVIDDLEPHEKVRIHEKCGMRNSEFGMPGIPHSAFITPHCYAPQVNMAEPLRLECDHFLDCIRDGQRPLTDGEAGLKVVQIIQGLEESMHADGQLVKMER